MKSPPTTVSTPKQISASHATWLRPASAHAHAGRRAASSSAHIEMPSGTQAIVTATDASTRSSKPAPATMATVSGGPGTGAASRAE